MCKFCDNLEWRVYKTSYRNSSTDDNMCERLSPDVIINGEYFGINCTDCDGCKAENISMFLRTCDNRMGINYYRKIKDMVIDQYSEMFSINFCPWCGKQLVEKLVDFDKCGLKE